MKEYQAEYHQSQRGWFAGELHRRMKTNEDIVVITADLGWGMFDKIRDDFPDRFLNVGAAEQAAAGIAVGLALEGKTPVFYSITPFLLYRPFEVIRNYINHEQVPVILVGGGRDRDYGHDGFSHWAQEDRQVMEVFDNIQSVWPEDREEMPEVVEWAINCGRPVYINLRR